MSQSITDGEIIARVLSGDTEAFAILYDRYHRYVGAVVVKHVPQTAVDELVTKVFLSAYRSLDKFESKGELRHWLATIARRRCCDYWRDQKAGREVSMSELGSEQQTWVRNAIAETSLTQYDAEQDQQHARRIVHWALERLDPEDRLLVIMVHLEGRSYEEAAQALGWGLPKTKMRAFQARNELRKRLKKLV
ncbi:MAG: RNA polymerase sigma factor [Bdellovibrionota bacterium]